MQHGSVINMISGSTTATPEVGMGVTFLYWTDRSAGTVVEVVSPREIKVRGDKSTRVDSNGMSDAQSYTFESVPDGPTSTYTLRKNGSWVRKGSGMKNGSRLALGYRDEYYDYSF